MSKVFLFPLIVFVLFQSTFICTYIAAILLGHVVPDVPYISDAATYSPESCVFGQLINMGCVLLGIVVYIRHRQIKQLIYHHPELQESSERMSYIAMWLGIASCLGCSIVANFQETNVRYMHYVGALTCFGFGTAYFWLQAHLSYNISPFAGSVLLAHTRLGLAVLCTIFFTIVAVTGVISHILFKGKGKYGGLEMMIIIYKKKTNFHKKKLIFKLFKTDLDDRRSAKVVSLGWRLDSVYVLLTYITHNPFTHMSIVET